jgi:hypothetical protein
MHGPNARTRCTDLKSTDPKKWYFREYFGGKNILGSTDPYPYPDAEILTDLNNIGKYTDPGLRRFLAKHGPPNPIQYLCSFRPYTDPHFHLATGDKWTSIHLWVITCGCTATGL